MKAIVKLKFWPLIIVGLACLFGTVVPFASKVARLLTEAVTQIVSGVFRIALTAEYAMVAPLLGPLAPTTGSHGEVVFRIGLGMVTAFTGVAVLTELAWLLRGHHRRRPETWICDACSGGKHHHCRGALLLVSRVREGTRPCQCEHCALNR